MDRASPLGVTVFGVWAALPVLLGVGSAYAPAVGWEQVGGWAWGSLLFSGGLAVGLAFVVWNEAVRRVGASNTAVYYYLVPFVSLVLGTLFLGEPITLAQVAGGGLIIGGLVVVRRST